MGGDSAGFQGVLHGVGLLELVQLFSQNGSSCAVEVINGSARGVLYFQHGRLVHAVAAGDLAGEDAAIEVLRWADGEFEILSGLEPSTATIHCSTDTILLRAAQSADESRAVELEARDISRAIRAQIPLACQTLEAIGEELGLEGFRSMEARTRLWRFKIQRHALGEVTYTSEPLINYEI